MKLYKSYVFKDKDPVIDKIRTLLSDEGSPTFGEVAAKSGVAASTVFQWIHGETKRPQYATIAAVVTSLGYEIGFTRAKGNVVSIKKRRVA